MEYMGGERENFKNIIYLGRISKEQRNMLFDDFKEKITITNFKQGEGYILLYGEDLQRVKVMKIDDIKKLNDSIKETLKR